MTPARLTKISLWIGGVFALILAFVMVVAPAQAVFPQWAGAPYYTVVMIIIAVGGICIAAAVMSNDTSDLEAIEEECR